ncbi:MAG: biosynthetic arginine decarboxylase [Planctomycetota bacterium]|nr:biosynthetic arginine decarboxylase [Planctomycetota bacterium]
MESLNGCFSRAIREQGYKGHYRGVYPVKVNQERTVVEAIVRHGRKYHFGLEAGSKPELMAVLSYAEQVEGLFICNGYKDEEYIDLALFGNKLGKEVVLVVEKLSELDHILEIAQRNQVRPILGLRSKLRARGTGRWESTSGDKSKFGLTSAEMLKVIEKLRARDMLDCLQLLHFHIGSQISNIQNMKNALKEAARFYVELRKLGAGMRYLDVGGGLAVDYDGSQTNIEGSMNYTIQEYANDVIFHVLEVCDEAEVEHPVLVSESGRAMTAHHSVVLCNILGVSEVDETNGSNGDAALSEDAPNCLLNLLHISQTVAPKNVREMYHDAVQMRDEAITLFNLGFLNLEHRAQAEKLFWKICRIVSQMIQELENVPEDLLGLRQEMASIYYCNFSVFQTLPDYWAINHLFPIMPIHRLKEQPTRQAMIADITCDSDGKIDEFIDGTESRKLLHLHPLTDQQYYIGIFLVGAYQEILGDLHNLFGDTNAVLVTVDDDGGYRIEQVEPGDTVEDVLQYVSYDKKDMIDRLRAAVEAAVRSGKLNLDDTRRFVKMYQDGMDGYTYLER